MYRVQTNALKDWKEKKNRKPLLIFGARQVGKTWLATDFGKKHFKKTAYINMDNNPSMFNLFDEGYDISNIISAFQIESKVNITPEDTLIIIDEIQEVPKAVQSLKYFYENAPEYYVIATGSKLGVALHNGTSFPVGKVNTLNLYPLSFYEYLLARDKRDLADLISSDNYALINSFSSELSSLLKEYYFVGGMPEAVKTFIDSNDFSEVRIVQKDLLSLYSNDFSKHAPANIAKRMQMVWDTIPKQLAKENKKFVYGLIREGARAREYEIAIQWLIDTGLVYKCTRVSKPYLPLKSYAEPENFKLYVLDTGLLLAMADIDVHTIIEGNRLLVDFKGALTEQYISGELTNHNIPLYYYSTPNSSGEIDFITQYKSSIIPIEVKAEENLKSKSLKAFRDKYSPELSIRTSLSNYKEQDWMINVPLFIFGEWINNSDSHLN